MPEVLLDAKEVRWVNWHGDQSVEMIRKGRVE